MPDTAPATGTTGDNSTTGTDAGTTGGTDTTTTGTTGTPPGQGGQSGADGGTSTGGTAPATGETDWKAHAREWEKRAKANHGAVAERDTLKAQLDAITKALNPDAATTPDPADLARQLEEQRAELVVERTMSTVRRLAAGLGADPDRLIDSRRFEDLLIKHEAIDPTAPNFTEQVTAAITAAVEADATFKAPATGAGAGGGPPRSGGQHTGSTSDGTDPSQMSMDDYVKYRRERDK